MSRKYQDRVSQWVLLRLQSHAKVNQAPQSRVTTYIEVADTCFEGDNGSYRHGENMVFLNNNQPQSKAIQGLEIRPHQVDGKEGLMKLRLRRSCWRIRQFLLVLC